MNMRLLLSICLVLIRSGSSEFLHSASTPEAGNVEVSSEHDGNMVNFTVTFELVKQPLWLAIGLNNQSKMFDTLVMIVKYNDGVIELYNGYNRDYITPSRESAPLNLIQEVRINNKVALVFQREVSFMSSVNPSVSNNLKNCYRMAIASGPLFSKFTLPHSQIPQFTQNCLVVAPEKIKLIPYYVNMSINSQFTDDLLDPNSAGYFRLRFRIEKFITDSLQADDLIAENFQLLSLSPGSVISLSGISLRENGLEQRIVDALVKGNTDFLDVIKDKIFISNSLNNSSTTTSTTIDVITTDSDTSSTLNTTLVNSTTTTIFINTTTATTVMNTTILNTTTTTSNVMNTTESMINSTIKTEITNSTAIQIDYFAAEFKISMNFTENLKNTSSDEYAAFVSKLDNYIKSGFLANNQIDALKSWKVENLRQGSILALTSLGVSAKQEENKVDFVRKNLESGDKSIIPVESIQIRNFDSSTSTSETSSATKATSEKKDDDDDDDDDSSVSAAAIAVPIVCVIFLIIVIIIAICIFRRRRRSKNSYILQTSEQNRAFDAASRTTEVPRNPPRFSSEDELSRNSVANLSNRFKSTNESPPSISGLKNQQRRDSGPPTYSMTDKSLDNFKEIPLEDDRNEKIEMNDINSTEKNNTTLNYDTSDIDDTRLNLGSIIKRSNNPLFQMEE